MPTMKRKRVFQLLIASLEFARDNMKDFRDHADTLYPTLSEVASLIANLGTQLDKLDNEQPDEPDHALDEPAPDQLEERMMNHGYEEPTSWNPPL